MDLDDSSDYDEEPVRFRSLSEVYEDTVEVNFASDTEIEVNALLALMEEPLSYQEAAGDAEWVAPMDSEMQSINKNQTWELVKLPAGHKPIGLPIGLKWVYKLSREMQMER